MTRWLIERYALTGINQRGRMMTKATPQLPDTVANALMTILAIIVFILFLPVALIVWQYDRHFKV